VPHPIYLTTALDDLAEILGYITRESGSLRAGQTFIAKLRNRCTYIASLPGTLGSDRSELGSGFRSVAANGYVIFFRYQDKRVEIVNVLHGSRDVKAYFDS
jgi:toxin ParE1/3/4